MADEKPQTAAQWVRQHSRHIKNTRLVLSTLANEIDAGNDCPSHNELCELTGLSKPTIQRALGELEKDGTITIVKNGGDVKNGGKKNCYTLPGMHPGKIDTRVKNTPVKLIPGKETPGKNPEDAPAHVSDAATRETDLSGKEKDKSIKTLFPAEAGKSNTPDEIDYAPDPFDGMIIAIGQIFGAIDKEALNYYNMLIGRSIKGDWIQPVFRVPMTEKELRSWWAWYHDKYPTVERVKKPEKIASSVAEYRRIQDARARSAPKQLDILTPAEKEAARRAFNFDVPEFSKIGSTP